jgi:urea transport system substrate-binding protein
MGTEEYLGLSHTLKPVRKQAPVVALGESVPHAYDTSADAPPAKIAGGTDRWVGRLIGRYQVISVLGKGAMGVVLRAFDPLLERDVAIKVLADELANDAVALARFLAEAKSAGRINHPNVMAIHEILQEESGTYLVLEYVAGGSVEAWLRERGALSLQEATRVLIDACQGVEAAHAAGMVHRDLKPANLIRTESGSIKIADFGLAKTLSDANHHLTHAGALVGTPVFMSPELCESQPIDHRSDIYALGATYYYLLTGARPYPDAGSISQLMYAHCHRPVPDPRSVNAAIPPDCVRIISRAMAKSPGDRYPSAEAMLADLRAVLSDPMAAKGSSDRPAQPHEFNAQSSPARATHPAKTRRGRGWRIPATLASVLIVAIVGLGITLSNLAVNDSPHVNAAVAPVAPVVAAVPFSSSEPVLVGVLHSLTGTMAASEEPVMDAVLFAIDEVNQTGGVLGRPVKAVVADGCSDSATFAVEAKRLLTQEKVATVFGCWTSASRKTVKPIFEEHDHLLIYPVQFEGLETSPCVFYLGAAPNQQILPAVDWAVNSRGKKRFFLVGSDYVAPRAFHAIIKDHLERTGGVIVGESFVPIGSQNVGGVVAAIAREKPDMILNTINGDTNIAFFRALRETGITAASMPTLSFCVSEQSLRGLTAAEITGDYAAWSYFQSLATPENADFVRRFQARYPRRPITDPMETAYAGVKLWAQAVNNAQSLEPRKIRRALVSERFQGPSGELRVDPDTQYSFRTPRIGEMQTDGQFKVIWSASEPIAPIPYPATRSAEAWHGFLSDLHRGWGNQWSAPRTDHPLPKSP